MDVSPDRLELPLIANDAIITSRFPPKSGRTDARIRFVHTDLYCPTIPPPNGRAIEIYRSICPYNVDWHGERGARSCFQGPPQWTLAIEKPRRHRQRSVPAGLLLFRPVRKSEWAVSTPRRRPRCPDPRSEPPAPPPAARWARGRGSRRRSRGRCRSRTRRRRALRRAPRKCPP